MDQSPDDPEDREELEIAVCLYLYVCVCMYVYVCISSKNTFGVKKARPSKVESYLEVNT